MIVCVLKLFKQNNEQRSEITWIKNVGMQCVQKKGREWASKKKRLKIGYGEVGENRRMVKSFVRCFNYIFFVSNARKLQNNSFGIINGIIKSGN